MRVMECYSKKIQGLGVGWHGSICMMSKWEKMVVGRDMFSCCVNADVGCGLTES